MTLSDIVDEGDDETSKHIYFDVVKNAEMYNSAVTMLSNVKKTGYAEMQESIIEDNKSDDKDFPTYHTLTKKCPKISRLSIIPLNSHSNDFTILEFESLLEIEAEI